MSILIKGMEMPTNDDMAPTAVWVYPNGYAIVFKNNGKMQQYTQAVSVPAHGRLIDADALLELIGFEVRHYVVKDDFDKGRVAAWNNVIHVIREYAPTIIPESEEGE